MHSAGNGKVVQEAKDPTSATSRLSSLLRALKERRLLTLIVKPSANCNLSCKFCDLHSGRIESVGKYKGLMKIDTWRTLMGQLVRLGYKLKQLQIHGNGEPLLHRQISDFIRIAKKSDIAESIRITTNGTLLSATKLDEIIKAGVDEIRVSVDAGDSKIWSMFKGKQLYDRLEKNVTHALEVVSKKTGIKLVLKYPVPNTDRKHSYGVTAEFMTSVIEKYSGRIQSSNVFLSAMPVVTLMDGMTRPTNRNPKPCEIPFYSLFVKYDGRISICCADITNQLDMGTVSAEGLDLVLNGQTLRNFRRNHLEEKLNAIPICLNCGNRTCVDLAPLKQTIMELI